MEKIESFDKFNFYGGYLNDEQTSNQRIWFSVWYLSYQLSTNEFCFEVLKVKFKIASRGSLNSLWYSYDFLEQISHIIRWVRNLWFLNIEEGPWVSYRGNYKHPTDAQESNFNRTNLEAVFHLFLSDCVGISEAIRRLRIFF